MDEVEEVHTAELLLDGGGAEFFDNMTMLRHDAR